MFTIFFIAVFLIASASFISAADADEGAQSKSIDVKIIWDDSGQSDRPSQVKLNLLDDGKVIDTLTLNADNSWEGTFKVNSDGNYQVKQDNNLSDYTVTVKGNDESGFVITNTLIANDVLGVSDEDSSAELTNTSDEDILSDNSTDDDNSTEEDNVTDVDDNSTDEDNALEDENSTVTTTSYSSGDDSSDDADKQSNDVTKKVKKQPKKVSKSKLKKTGIPMAALVLVAFTAAFVPFSRKK